MANPFNILTLTNMEKVGPLALKFTYDNGYVKVVNNLIWLFVQYPDGTSHLSITQDGTGSSIGVYGQRITPEDPIIIEGSAKTDPSEIEQWLINNLIAI